MNFSFSSYKWSICQILLIIESIKGARSNDMTRKLCSFKTDELIRHYGYEAEVHHVVTDDGYIITIFRCNSYKFPTNNMKPVILQHGLLNSSDDFCVNTPNYALAYILADAGYDVWLPNSRGSYYSREHISKSPDSQSSGFWNFSWFEMGIYDQPAAIDYILQQTNSSKLYYVGFSQGTTSLMVLLSEKPEYNDKIYVASMMAPVGYMSHSDSIYRLFSYISSFMDPTNVWELLPRKGVLSDLKDTFCSLDFGICNSYVDLLFGPSEYQRNNAMLQAFICHIPSGSSYKQFNHYVQETKYGFFGKYMTGSKKPRDFELSKITVPISLHYSVADRLSNVTDVEMLLPKLKNVIFAQRIGSPYLNHIDFLWGSRSASLIYSNILKIFQMFQ